MSSNTEVPIFKRAMENSPQMFVIQSESNGALPKDPDSPRLSPTTRNFLPAILLLIAVLALFTPPAHAQGCAQCLDSTRATPPAVRAAYRHAIELLGGFGVTLFVAGLILLRREP